MITTDSRILERFHESAEAVGTRVIRCADAVQASAALTQLAAGEAVQLTPLPAQLQPLISGLTLADPAVAASTRLTVSHATAGIAATGSLLLTLPEPAGRGATALATVHVVLLEAATIVPDLAALAPRLRELLGSNQAYLSLTTGPSRTADIERVLTIGVHGPKELHIILLEGCL